MVKANTQYKDSAMPEPFWREDRKAWYVWYKDEDGKWRQKKAGRTKDEAWAQVIATERDLQPVRLGLVDPAKYKQSKHAQRPIVDIIREFESHLRGRKVSENHIRVTIGDLCTVFGADDPDKDRRKRRAKAQQGYKPDPLKWDSLADIDAGQFAAFLDKIANRLSIRRRNRYRAGLLQLVRWAVDHNMLASNPISTIEAMNHDRDRRRVRRALTVDEFWRLIETTRDQNIGGPKRALYYWIAGRAGLRWAEIARLEKRHIDLNDIQPCLILTADITKNGRDSVVPLDLKLAKALKATTFSGKKLFATEPTRLTWMRDLKRAGIEYQTEEGFAYRGCLRTTFGTHLYEAGVDLRTAQELMRHSDPKLTANIYQRVRLTHTRKGIDELSGLDDRPNEQSENVG